MAKKNPGDILTCDWNPVIGCSKYSIGCKHCWYLEGIFPWQQRLGNIPKELTKNDFYVFDKRMSVESLKPKNGIVGVVQHGDLFWSAIPDETIHKVLDIIEETYKLKKNKNVKYLLWTKRAERMARILSLRYPSGLPHYLGCSVSMENQQTMNERMPWLTSINGFKVAMFEPMLGEAILGEWVNKVDWVVVGSETGVEVISLKKDWVRSLRDETKAANKPFFVKQLGNNHRKPDRDLDGVEWTEFPEGWSK